MKLQGGRSSWLITIGLAAVSIGYLYYVFLPGRRNIEKLEEQVNQKQAYLAQQPALKASLASTDADVGEVEKFVADWRKIAPVASQLSATFGKIHHQAQAAGVDLEKFDPQTATNMHTVRRVPVNLSVEGTFSQLHALLRSLEEMPNGPWIESLRFERGKDVDAPLRGEITLVIFTANPEISD